jgi:Na+/H+ antiporter NhaD/arsenite permease-like protein
VHPVGIAVFVVTYVLISARRLPWLGFDRPASALLGAVACVALGVLTPQAALEAIDGNTILLLFGMMGLGAVLADDGFFSACADRAVRVARTPTRLLGLVVWGSGLLSALVTNDAVCVLAAPLVVTLIQRHRLPAAPLLLALATGANTGSVATLVGNPQNMLCATLGGLDYRSHLVIVGPVAVAALAINHALLWWRYRDVLRGSSFVVDDRLSTSFRAARASIAVVGLTVVAATLGVSLPWCAVGGLVLVQLIKRTDTSRVWPAVDWSVLVFFAGLFVVVAGFVHSGGPAWLFARVPLWTDGGWWRLSGLFLVGSNVVSNVPFILVIEAQMATLPNARLGWELLAVVSTFAGNLTLLGSVANIIVAEAGRDVGGLSFVEHLKVGLPLALVSSAVGAAWLVGVMT